MSARGIDLVQTIRLRGRCAGTPEQVAQPDDRVERRANLVAHVGQERALGVIGGFGFSLRGPQLFGAQVDQLFKVVAMTFELCVQLSPLGDVLHHAADLDRLAVLHGRECLFAYANMLSCGSDVGHFKIERFAGSDGVHRSKLQRFLHFRRVGSHLLLKREPGAGLDLIDLVRFPRPVGLHRAQIKLPAADFGNLARMLKQIDRARQRLANIVLLRHVAEHQYDTHCIALAIAYRCRAVGDLVCLAITRQQCGVVGERDDFVSFKHAANRAVGRLSAACVNDVEHFCQIASRRVRQRPAGKFLCGCVHANHVSSGVGTDHRIANGLKRDRQIFLAQAQLLFGEHALGDIIRQHQHGSAITKFQRMRANFNANHAAVLAHMLPEPATARTHIPGIEVSAQSCRFFCRANVPDFHREEFLAAIAVVKNGRLVHVQKVMRLGVPDPHRLRIASKQFAVARLVVAQRLLGLAAPGDVNSHTH